MLTVSNELRWHIYIVVSWNQFRIVFLHAIHYTRVELAIVCSCASFRVEHGKFDEINLMAKLSAKPIAKLAIH